MLHLLREWEESHLARAQGSVRQGGRLRLHRMARTGSHAVREAALGSVGFIPMGRCQRSLSRQCDIPRFSFYTERCGLCIESGLEEGGKGSGRCREEAAAIVKAEVTVARVRLECT